MGAELLLAKLRGLVASRRFWVAVATIGWIVFSHQFSSLFLGVAIVAGAWIVGDSMRPAKSAVVLALLLVLPGVLDAADPYEVCRAATVRVRNKSTVGTGTVFRHSDQHVYCLTNAHVAGVNLGNQVSVEFWRLGHQSRQVPGETVVVSYVRGAYRDVAVVRVDRRFLGDYLPPVIPIEADGTAADYARLYSVGCAAGRWPSAFEGFGIAKPNVAGDVLHFVPTPAGGRSGSGLFKLDGDWPTIIGVIGWRSASAADHSFDGFSEAHGYGIAMTHREIWAALRGDEPRSSYVPFLSDLAPPGVVQCQATDKGSPDEKRAKTKTGSGGDGSVVLEFSDPIALAPDAVPLQAYDAYGQGYCGPNGCPPQNPQQPQERDRLFPSLPVPPRYDGGGQVVAPPAFAWRELIPWALLGLVIVCVMPRIIDRFFPRSTSGK